MTSVQLAIDDFDPLFVYEDYTIWATPNPQDNPTWWNASSQETGSTWNQATYHYTTTPDAKVSLNFTGSSITVLGAGGPSNTNFTATLDPSSAQPYVQTLSPANATDGRTVLFHADGLNTNTHTLEIVNHGDGLLLDMAVVDVVLGAEGATLTNTTVQNDDSRIQYSGTWTTQSGPNFNGGTSTYTSGPGNEFKFSFEGSAVYIYGDQVNDHGLYNVYLNGSSSPYAALNGRSGCGGGYAKYCEKLHGLAFFAGSLPAGTHEVRLVNGGPTDGNVTFFDFDYIEYTVPSTYPQLVQSNADCPFTNCSAQSSPSGSAGASTSTIAGSAAASTSGGPSSTASGGSSPAQSTGAAVRGAAPMAGVGEGTGVLAALLGIWGMKLMGW